MTTSGAYKKIYFANVWPQIITTRGEEIFKQRGFEIYGNWLNRDIKPHDADFLIYPPADFGGTLRINSSKEFAGKMLLYILFPDSMVGWDHEKNVYKTEKKNWIDKLFIKNKNLVLSHSHHSLNLIEETYGRLNTQVLHLGIDFEGIRSLPCGKERRLKVLWNHMWRSDKGAIEAFTLIKQLASKYPWVDFYIGREFDWEDCANVENYKESCQNVLKKLRLFRNVYFVKKIKGQANYWGFLKKFDISFSTSFHEGFGLSMLEQAAAGIACVVPDEEVYPEVLKDSLIVKRDKLSNAISMLIENKELRQEVQEKSVLNASIYDISIWVDRLTEILKFSN